MDVDLNLSLTINEKKLQSFLSRQNEKILEQITKKNNDKDNKVSTLPTNYLNKPLKISQGQSGNYHQYASLYISRLNLCYNPLKQQAEQKWPNTPICRNILDLKGKDEKVIIGITFKEMPLKPSILKGVEAMIGIKKVESFVNEAEDFLSLEDSSGRIKINSELSKSINIGEFITGIPVALKGVLDEKGLFIVNDYEFYQIKTGEENAPAPLNSEESENVILFVSGLHFGDPSEKDGKLNLSREMLIDFIQKKNLSDEYNKISEKITRVIICGNSIYSPPDTELVEKGSFSKSELNTRIYKTILENYESFDSYLQTLSNYIPVDVMPGEDDDNSIFFPDTELKELMFPQCKNVLNKTLNLVTNPYYFNIDKKDYIGTSGENVDSIRQCSVIKDPLDIMEKTLRWGHLAPSAPNDLRCFPFQKNDPLILEKIPDFYFVGGQKEFSSKIVDICGKSVALISIPDFYSSFSCGILNTKTKEIKEIKFIYTNE